MCKTSLLVARGAVMVALVSLSSGIVEAAEADLAGRWLHPTCKPLEITKTGPFIVLDDGTLMMVDGNRLATSADDGKTWTPTSGAIHPGLRMGGGGQPGHLVRMRSGVLVIVFLDFTGYKFSWDNAKGAPKDDCKLEMYAIRSTDGGKTWTDTQLLLGGYNADFMGFIETSKGWLVATVEHLCPELRRWVSCSFVSTDEGKTWRQGNLIDLGGHGHHDGAVEPMVAELSDGRLLMLIRTNLDRFWQAFSTDGGRYWRRIEPTTLDASSSPGWLIRTKSGKLALVYNRLNPEGRTVKKRNHAGPASEFPASWHREELSLAFSSDDAKTWTKPVVIARQPGGVLCYPFMLERRPGELWITTHGHRGKGGKRVPPLMVRVMEEAFLAGVGQ